ncbi:TPA_asm: hypothetical protein [Psilorhabdovirus 2]|nr:TPA_asm: hypothetical protein [Psilorhabdovirus 2]
MSRKTHLKALFKGKGMKSPSPEDERVRVLGSAFRGVLEDDELASSSISPSFMNADSDEEPPSYDLFLEPGIAPPVPLEEEELYQYNASVCTKIIINNVDGALTKTNCQKILFILQTQYSGSRYLLPMVIYSLGRGLCKLESYGKGAYIGTDNAVLKYSIPCRGFHNRLDPTSTSCEVPVSGGTLRVTATYEIQPSLFIGKSFPDKTPEWIRDVMRVAKSYKIRYCTRSHHFYIM